MRSFWKVAAFRLTESIRIQSGRRALRCFQNELHHFIILNPKWYQVSEALTGRMALVELDPFSLTEIDSGRWRDLWLYGGYAEGGILSAGRYPLVAIGLSAAVDHKGFTESGSDRRPSGNRPVAEHAKRGSRTDLERVGDR